MNKNCIIHYYKRYRRYQGIYIFNSNLLKRRLSNPTHHVYYNKLFNVKNKSLKIDTLNQTFPIKDNLLLGYYILDL